MTAQPADSLTADGLNEYIQPSQFRSAYEDVERIFTLTSAPDLMSLGPTVVDADTAVNDGWLESLRDFRPMLRAANVSGISVTLDGTEYTGATFFFKRGGNNTADKKWLGDLTFMNGTDDLEYKLYADGRIKLTKCSAGSPWIQFCWAHESQAHELSSALVKVKEHLHSQKVGQLALSQ